MTERPSALYGTASGQEPTLNLLVTLDARYLPPLKVMLTSLLHANPFSKVDLYLLHSSLSEEDLKELEALPEGNRCRLYPIFMDDSRLEGAPISDRYPREMYYRIFAARYLPRHLDRVLYLDPDMIILGSLHELYTLPLGNHLFAAASHVRSGVIQKFNELRLDMEDGPYINSGVMLMNLDLLRREQDVEAVYRYIEEHRKSLLLPDQDILSGLYASRILPLDPYRYNMTEKLFALRPDSDAWLNLDWVRRHSVIIHYCGRNKPWKEPYFGKLDIFYREFAKG